MSRLSQARVKSVLSGDTLVLTSVNNPTQERLLSLAFVDAPRLKREGDAPYAWQARQLLIDATIGKVVQFQVLYNIPGAQSRDFGIVFLEDGTQFPLAAVQAGCLKIRDNASRNAEESEKSQEILEKLQAAEAQAKTDSKGLWASSVPQINVLSSPPDAEAFVSEWKGKTLEGQAEKIMTGDRVIMRLFTSPDEHLQTLVLLAGIRAPSTKRTLQDGSTQAGEPFGEDAVTFLDTRILQRTLDVNVIGVSPNGQLICSIKHKKGGDMSENLLKSGLARCIDHHSTMLGGDMSKLRSAERLAKTGRLNVWQGQTVSTAPASESEVVVSRVQTADTIYVRNKNGDEKRVQLSSVRQPKPTDPKQSPFQADAKEFLRKKLIGKHVKISVDGKKPASEGFDEREVATVLLGGKNVATGLVEAGYASVIRHRKDDNDRSPYYDELLAAEEAAQTEQKGMWSPKAPAAKQYQDYSESLQKAKVQASVLQRQKKIPAIVDFVKGPSRFTVLIPRENAKLTLVLSCLRAPRSARPGEKAEPFGQEAHDFASKRLQQRDVEIDIEGTDKVGGFIGTIYVNRENFSKALLEEGFASVHTYSAEQSPNGAELIAAETKAKEARKGMWHDYQEQDEEIDAPAESYASGAGATGGASQKLVYKEVMLTNIDPETLRLKVQEIGTGAGALEEMMNKFRAFHLSPGNAKPLSDAPKAGDFVSAKFSEDNTWYRARIRRNDRENKVAEVVYIDYGNEEKLPWSSLRPLATQFSTATLRAQAQDAVLSYVQMPTSKEYLADAVSFLEQELGNQKLAARVDFTDAKENNLMYLTLFKQDNPNVGANDSVNGELVREGLAIVPKKLKAWERAATVTLDDLKAKQKEASDRHAGMWEYGDLTED